MVAQPSERPASTWIVAALLLVSGACALAYQVVWMRELRLVFGATTAASAAVLAIFMAGLGLGNAILGSRIDRSPRPVYLYALLEGGIAASTILTPFLIDLAAWIYVSMGGQSALGQTVATVVRLIASALILAAPTFLMGGTMPAAARSVSRETDLHRRGVALIYGLNTLGAVAGAGLANFFLIEPLGSRAVLWSACAVNLLLAAAAFALSRKLLRADSELGVQIRPSELPEKTGARPANVVCLASFVVGFAFFLMEIVWYRMLGPILGGTTYTFGLILCVALLGIGMGGAIYHVAARWLRPTLGLFALTCAAEAALAAWPFGSGDDISLWVLQQQRAVIDSFAEQVWNWFVVASFVILPTAVVAGFQFPVLIAAAGQGRRDVASHVGWIFAANTCGAICGSLAGGFVLLPFLTAPGCWRLVVATLALLALVFGLLSLRDGASRRLSFVGSIVGSAFAFFAISAEGPTAVWRHSGIGAGRAEINTRDKNLTWSFMKSRRRQCIWEADGIESSVGITATEGLSFIVNGKADGNAFTDAGTQIGLGLIGPLLHHRPATALVIGLGTGETAGWLAGAGPMTSVDVVELEPAVLEMATRCSMLNRNALENTKIQIHFNDAREFLLTAKRTYDLIVSEPSNPYRAGIANLYTREFYQSARERLAEDGLFLQWLQGYEIDDRTVQIVLQTLRSVFPDIEVWRTRARDLLLVCGNQPLSYHNDSEALRGRLREPVIAEGFRRAWGVVDLEGILAHYVCGRATVDRFCDRGDPPLNTDDRNHLEFAFARTVGRRTWFSAQDLQALAHRNDDRGPPLDGVDWAQVARRGITMHLFLGSIIPSDALVTAADRPLALALDLYLRQAFRESLEQFRHANVDLSCPLETRIYAHVLAEIGVELPTDVATALSDLSELDRAAVNAIWLWQTQQQEKAVEEMERVFRMLQDDPWGSEPILERLFTIASDMVFLEAPAPRRLFSLMREPFLAYRKEEKRNALACWFALNLGPDEVIETLARIEPNVPWFDWVLKPRAEVYQARRHPRAADAVKDWKQYQAWAGGK